VSGVLVSHADAVRDTPGAARRLTRVLAALAVCLVLVAATALVLGSADVSPGAVIRVLTGRAEPDSIERVVTLGLRLPRILVAILAGGGLAVAGVGFQALTRNPLAEPSILGISGGAAFGVVVAQIFGLGLTVVEALGLTAFAFAGAVAAAAAVYLIAAGQRGLAVPTLLLAGVIVGIFFSSAITVVISVVDFNRLGAIVHWLLGNLAPIPPGALAIFAGLSALGFGLIASQARELNLLALGEEPAAQLGVDTERVKLTIFAGAALLTATVVAFTGPIGFVGLVVPHVLRGLVGPDNRLLVPTAMVAGGIFLLVADTIARTVVAPAELAVGVITSFCGAPFFVVLLRTRYRGVL
jgi:iron complex transport system permease protein